jgi:hypothetical protein
MGNPGSYPVVPVKLVIGEFETYRVPWRSKLPQTPFFEQFIFSYITVVRDGDCFRYNSPYASACNLRRVSIVRWSGANAQFNIEDSHTTASLRGIHNVGGVAWASGTNGTVLRPKTVATSGRPATFHPEPKN